VTPKDKEEKEDLSLIDIFDYRNPDPLRKSILFAEPPPSSTHSHVAKTNS